jgi:3-methyladenine DNA glycosylase AlkD
MVEAAALMEELRAQADPVRAVVEQRYLKSERPFLGCGVPAVRAAVRRREAGLHDRAAVVALARALWALPEHEAHHAAVVLLGRKAKQLTLDDVPLLERILREGKTWALADTLITSVMPTFLNAHPEAMAVLDRWATDPDFWVRRSAMLSLEPDLRRGKGDWERFVRYADGMLGEREFFIQKCIGWVARSAGRRDPDRLRRWLEPRITRLSRTSLVEALKPLEESEQVRLHAEWKAARPSRRNAG